MVLYESGTMVASVRSRGEVMVATMFLTERVVVTVELFTIYLTYTHFLGHKYHPD